MSWMEEILDDISEMAFTRASRQNVIEFDHRKGTRFSTSSVGFLLVKERK